MARKTGRPLRVEDFRGGGGQDDRPRDLLGIMEGSRVSDETMAEPNRRDILFIATGAMAAVAAGAAVWPLIEQMNPDASTLALASTEVDLSAIVPGQIVTVKWRGKPVFVRHRTAKEIAAAEKTPLAGTARSRARLQARQEAGMAGRGRRLHASGLHSARP